MTRITATVALLTVALWAGLALAQNDRRIMDNPSLHPEGDGMVLGSDRPSGMPFRPATPEEMADRCGASALQHLVGGRWPAALPPLVGPLRVYATGDAVTMDLNPGRLNVETTPRGTRVVAVRCG